MTLYERMSLNDGSFVWRYAGVSFLGLVAEINRSRGMDSVLGLK